MALAQKFIGVSPVTGQSIQGDAASYAAAGSGQSTATDLTTSTCIVSSGTGGVQAFGLYGGVGDEQTVLNTSGSSITVYPPTGAKINQLSTNTGITLANNSTVLLKMHSATQVLAILSA